MEIRNGVKDMRLIHPANFIIAGQTGIGKTSFLTKLLLSGRESLTVDFDKVIYFYGVSQPAIFNLLRTSKKFEFQAIEGLPRNIEFDPRKKTAIVIDDLMVEAVRSKYVSDLFSKFARRNNASIFILYQNVFVQGPYQTNIKNNTSYVILFRTPRAKLEITALSNQYLFDHKYLLEAFLWATKNNRRGYLLIDHSSAAEEGFQLRTDVIPVCGSRFYLPNN
jgi:hypothetical protein